MLQLFPGRTLEEIDGIDYGRFARALEARGIERLLGKLRDYQADGKVKLTRDEWAAVAELDALEARHYGG